MITQDRLRRLHSTEKRYRPRPRTVTAMRFPNIRRQRTPLLHIRTRTLRFLAGGSSLFRTRHLDLLVAPLGIYEFSIIAKADMVASEIVPKKTRCRIVDVGHVVIERKVVRNLTLKIVGALLAAVGDLPGLLVVVGCNRRGRPLMPIPGDFPAVVEVVEHPKLQRELMLVRRNVFSVKRKRWISVSHLQISEDLIECTVFLDDVDHVLNRILSAGEGELSRITLQQIIALHRLRELRQALQD